jgi:hypothetical protein
MKVNDKPGEIILVLFSEAEQDSSKIAVWIHHRN